MDRPYLGILLMLGFCLLVPVADAGAKLLGGRVSIMHLLLARFLVQSVMLLPLVWSGQRSLQMSRRIGWLMVLRTALHIIGIGMMFVSLRYLPLADAIAIAFVMPFFLLLFGRFVLKESVGANRMLACIVGFAGTLLVMQPSFAQVGAPALLPLGVAIAFAGFMLVTRPLAQIFDPVSVQAISGLMGFAFLSALFVVGAFFGWSGFETAMPNRADLLLLIGVGVMGTLAHLLMTWSLRFAPSSTLAPMQYLEIPVATLVGWIVFTDIPNAMAAVGILTTVLAGLYVVLSERAVAGRRAKMS